MIPCGRVMGHGECCDSWRHLCDRCLLLICCGIVIVVLLLIVLLR